MYIQGYGDGLRHTRNGALIFNLFLAFALSSCLVGPCNAWAGGQSGRGGGHPRASHNVIKSPTIEMRVQRLAKQLNLNDVQQFDLKRLLEVQQAEVARLWRDPAVAPMDRVMKLQALHDDSQKQFHALLTQEQRQKYDEMLQKKNSPLPAAAHK